MSALRTAARHETRLPHGPRLDSHRDTQTVWPLRAPTPIARVRLSGVWSFTARAGAATRTGVSKRAWLCQGTAAKKESGSPVRGIEESDRAASLAFTRTKIPSGAVPHGSGRAEHQTTGPLPKPPAAPQPRIS